MHIKKIYRNEDWKDTFNQFKALDRKKTGDLGDFFERVYRKEYESGEYKLEMSTDWTSGSAYLTLDLYIKGIAKPKNEWDHISFISYNFEATDPDSDSPMVVAPGKFDIDPTNEAIAYFVHKLETKWYDDYAYSARDKIRLADNFPEELVRKAFADVKQALPKIYRTAERQAAYDKAGAARGDKRYDLKHQLQQQWYAENPIELGEEVYLRLPGRESQMKWTVTDINGDTLTVVNAKGVEKEVPVEKVRSRNRYHKETGLPTYY